jgi:hypothetical protein
MFALNLGLKLKSSHERVRPFISLMPGLYVPFGVEYESSDAEPGYRYRIQEEWSFAPGFGFGGSVGMEIRVAKAAFFSLSVAPTYAFARLKEVNWTDTNLETNTTDRGIIYWEVDEPNLPDDTQVADYRHGGTMYSFSSCDFMVGISFCF